MLIRAEVKGIGRLPDGHYCGALEQSDIYTRFSIVNHKHLQNTNNNNNNKMKVNSKIVNRMVSNTKRIKNKLVNNGRQEFENENDSDDMPTRILKSKKSAAKNSKLIYLKSQLSLSYKPLA